MACWKPPWLVRRPPPSARTPIRTLDAKAAGLLHSLARNHALIDGNKRLALAALIAFYGLNGRRLTLTNDAAYDLVMNVASGHLDSVDEIAACSTAPHNPATDGRLEDPQVTAAIFSASTRSVGTTIAASKPRAGGWKPETGVLVWHTPAGRTYSTTPTWYAA